MAYHGWSAASGQIPNSINSQLVGTFPAVVRENTRELCPAFFVRAAGDDLAGLLSSGAVAALVRPQFVKTPQGPMVICYCMASPESKSADPFVSETALFPRLASTRTHREIVQLLKCKNKAYLVACDEKGACLMNLAAEVRQEWRDDLMLKSKAFDEGKQIADERAAIMSLYWYQERYNPSSKIFEVAH